MACSGTGGRLAVVRGWVTHLCVGYAGVEEQMEGDTGRKGPWARSAC